MRIVLRHDIRYYFLEIHLIFAYSNKKSETDFTIKLILLPKNTLNLALSGKIENNYELCGLSSEFDDTF